MKKAKYMLMVYSMDHGCYEDYMASDNIHKLELEATFLRTKNNDITTIRRVTNQEPVNYENVFSMRHRLN